ncbi:helix-turn-helix domain-containing protein [Convivina praedatoris]|uniref:HTH cro/C1-type domain-containing protein n=1 Tax=Convivina praedatoris TaxID=2880963 RepID=A0ABM9D2Y0_9LACO|nr:helix-turn-helix transcriptional regulator [Convivina sp. LMG 32447]CAH1856172.1 hypothetical protein LMG032447_01248 [Convivina sp. LMG 32447]
MKNNRIKELRLGQGLSLVQLSKAIGVSQPNLSRYETGYIKHGKKEVWERLAKFFNVSVPYIQGADKEVSERLDKAMESVLKTMAPAQEVANHIEMVTKPIIESMKPAQAAMQNIQNMISFSTSNPFKESVQQELPIIAQKIQADTLEWNQYAFLAATLQLTLSNNEDIMYDLVFLSSMINIVNKNHSFDDQNDKQELIDIFTNLLDKLDKQNDDNKDDSNK